MAPLTLPCLIFAYVIIFSASASATYLCSSHPNLLQCRLERLSEKGMEKFLERRGQEATSEDIARLLTEIENESTAETEDEGDADWALRVNELERKVNELKQELERCDDDLTMCRAKERRCRPDHGVDYEKKYQDVLQILEQQSEQQACGVLLAVVEDMACHRNAGGRGFVAAVTGVLLLMVTLVFVLAAPSPRCDGVDPRIVQIQKKRMQYEEELWHARQRDGLVPLGVSAILAMFIVGLPYWATHTMASDSWSLINLIMGVFVGTGMWRKVVMIVVVVLSVAIIGPPAAYALWYLREGLTEFFFHREHKRYVNMCLALDVIEERLAADRDLPLPDLRIVNDEQLLQWAGKISVPSTPAFLIDPAMDSRARMLE